MKSEPVDMDLIYKGVLGRKTGSFALRSSVARNFLATTISGHHDYRVIMGTKTTDSICMRD